MMSSSGCGTSPPIAGPTSSSSSDVHPDRPRHEDQRPANHHRRRCRSSPQHPRHRRQLSTTRPPKNAANARHLPPNLTPMRPGRSCIANDRFSCYASLGPFPHTKGVAHARAQRWLFETVTALIDSSAGRTRCDGVRRFRSGPWPSSLNRSLLAETITSRSSSGRWRSSSPGRCGRSSDR